MKNAFLVLLCLPFIALGQQDSKIKLDSSNNNEITVTQEGNDSAKSADISLSNSDSNRAKVLQATKDSVTRENKAGGFISFISNTNTVFVLLISIATLIGLVWKGLPYLKKLTRKK